MSSLVRFRAMLEQQLETALRQRERAIEEGKGWTGLAAEIRELAAALRELEAAAAERRR